MRQSRFSDEQLVKILREADASTVAETAKQYGISEQTIDVWKRRFGMMTVDETKQKKALEVENARLRRMLIQRDLEIEVMKEIAGKKW